jgi:serine/threonine-protein kinase MRCK
VRLNLCESLLALVHPDNQLNAFLMYSGVDAWRVIELSSQGAGNYGEFLLVFQTLSIYVDIQGRKSRDREIMYPAVPTHISEFTFNFPILWHSC